MRVLSFNVRCAVAQDGANGWEFRKDLAARLIQEVDAPLVGLQEAFENQNQDLLQRLSRYQRLGVGRDDGDRQGEHCSILFDPAVLSPLDQGTFWLSPTPDRPSLGWGARLPRICTWADFGKFRAYNLHLDHESEEARRKGVNLVLAHVIGPAIVMGDFNADEADPVAEAMRTAGFRDTYRVIHPEGPADTFTGFADVAHPGKIDYIWVSPEWNVTNAGVRRDRYEGRHPSDHDPVYAELTFR